MRKLFIINGLILLTASAYLSCSPPDAKQTAKGEAPVLQENQVLKGEYLVNIMGCHDCHSPKIFGPQGPEPDPERLLSGHPANQYLGEIDVDKVGPWIFFSNELTATVGPWGASFAANITSDATGIGNWTEEQFSNAIRKGMYKGQAGGRKLLPPMPWQMFSHLSDEDVAAIFAYLKTVKPVRNVPPTPMPLEAFRQ
jgi:hypothetical protein